MPHHKSARKRLRSDARKRASNRVVKSRMRTAVKKVETCTDQDEASSLLRSAVSAIDKATRTRAVHRGKADRQKSQLARHVNSLSQGSH